MKITNKLIRHIKAIRNIIKNEANKIAIKENPSIWIKNLQRQGVDIADDVIPFGTNNISIDLTRPSLIHIGSKTFLHNGFKVLTHDYCTYTFINKYKEFIPSSGKVFIGENVWFGENVTVLKGTHIGNNCIIGINSVVMGKIPDNSVAAGCPAKVICSLDEYFAKRVCVCVLKRLLNTQEALKNAIIGCLFHLISGKNFLYLFQEMKLTNILKYQ